MANATQKKDQPDMHGNCQSVELLECLTRDSRLETELFEELLKHEKNKTTAKI